MAETDRGEEQVDFMVKHPSLTSGISFKLSAEGCVAQLREKVHEEFPGKPETSAIVLIYAGRVLKDDGEKFSSFLRPTIDSGMPQILHLVIRSSAASSSTPQTATSIDVPAAAARPASDAGQSSAPTGLAETLVEQQALPEQQQPEIAGTQPTVPVPIPPSTATQQQNENPAVVGRFASLLSSHVSAVASASTSAAYAAALQALTGTAPDPGGNNNVALPFPPQLMPVVVDARGAAAGGPGRQPPMQVAVLRQRGVGHADRAAADQAREGQPIIQFMVQNNNNWRAMPRGVVQRRPPGIIQSLRELLMGFNINIRALLQLIVLLAVVYQNCPPRRFIALVLLGVALWLTTTAPIRRLLADLAGGRAAGAPVPGVAPGPLQQQEQPPPQQQPGFGEQPRDGQAPLAAGEAANEQAAEEQIPAARAAEQRDRRGLLREAATLFIGFFSSILPGWQLDPAEAEAIAAAQAGWNDAQPRANVMG